MTDEKLVELYNKQLKFTDELCADYKPMQVAAILMAQALSIYRSGLSNEDYNSMVDTISASRGQVKTFDKVVLQ
jgi:hypothetical protein